MEPKLFNLRNRLFVRPHTRGIDSAVMLNLLRREKIGYVLNVAIIPDDYLPAACRTIGIAYKHHPLSDSILNGVPENVADLIQETAKALSIANVMVHCDSAYNRSWLVGIPALAQVLGCSTSELIAEAREFRPKVLKNPTFEKYVRDYNA